MGSSFYLCVDTSIELVYAEHLFDQLEQRTEQLEQVMSRFRPDSELVRLNQRVGEWVRVSRTLRQVLDLAALFHHVSGGAFDPRVIRHLEQIGYPGAPIDVSKSADSAMSLDDPLFDTTGTSGEVCLHHPLDLGGIGKGYAADSLADLLASSIASSDRYGFIVDAGGDIVLSGCQESGAGWSIGVEDPYGGAEDLAATVEFPASLERIAMCTSSLKKRSWSFEGNPVHHLIDPRQAGPARTRFRAVTAVGPTATHTEVFTKCKMISTTVANTNGASTEGIPDNGMWEPLMQSLTGEPESGYSWRSTALPYIAVDVTETLEYTSDIAPILTWISSKYQHARVV
ncbi:hypothetical protein AN477_16820 [Alicyclobacillus ferrooxydans]|uniref:FAD:protein FMN transferase n=2 Tax=Alicyclobacillus ferrooxydans TaxID=471514 RepID=A0A0P9CHW3_9BACL|nr:hypothetical protein AN477_16820 [Alicyclobacillus ferrooxydans]